MSTKNDEFFVISTRHGDFKTNKLTPSYINRKKWTPRNPLEVRSFIPGNVVEFKVAVGDIVKAGDVLLLYKAMKMNSLVRSSVDGVVKELCVETGESLRKGALLLTFEE